MKDKYILLATCSDKVGITSLITNIIAKHNSNILHLDHFTEYDSDQDSEGKLYLRFEFEKVDTLKHALEQELQDNNIEFELFDNSKNKNCIICF